MYSSSETLKQFGKNPHKHLAQKVSSKYIQIRIIKTTRTRLRRQQRKRDGACEKMSVFTSGHS